MENKILQGDVLEKLKELPDETVDCCITSPPYFGLRDYQVEGQIGLEKTPEEYVGKMVLVFREVRRVLKKEGVMFLNLGDSYASNGREGGDIDKDNGMDIERGRGRLNKHPIIKPKDLVGIPWRVAFALQADGWYLRQDIIWAKPNPMPESVTDRCTKSHEYVFLMTKSPHYYFDHEAIKELATGYDGRKDTMMKGSEKYKDGDYLIAGNANSLSVKGRERWQYKNLQEDGQNPNSMHEKRLVGEEYLSPVRNKRSVWTVPTHPFKGAHFATFPEDLIIPMIKAGCPKEVCKKCGKGRERLFQTIPNPERSQSGRTHSKESERMGKSPVPEKGWETIKFDMGYSNCGCNRGFVPGLVLDIFMGSGTTAVVAKKLGRNYLGIEINPEYIKIAEKRIAEVPQALF